MFRIESEDIEVGAGAAVVRVTQHYRTLGPLGAGNWESGVGNRKSQVSSRLAETLLPLPFSIPDSPFPPLAAGLQGHVAGRLAVGHQQHDHVALLVAG
ncbi:hypothetical protein DGM85_07130 [Xanthomonas phaseoli pv. phaseoli]|nr:hypothetical protein DGM93_06890 [Xanthomonas phaseoli pv. phaseoli]QWN28316.1 hypothetical protein DGM85_07130 [Xanthomonas phaseoli pv. phaseoli]QWN32462.1 hypothetical protein DGM81_06915 [Xanthomonas phaseoli pv. phaseoli]